MCVCLRTTVGELEGENAALVQVQLVLVRFGDVQDFHVTALHSHSQPLACRTVAQGEDLGDEEGEERKKREVESEEALMIISSLLTH